MTSLWSLWGEWEIRVLLLGSLSLQVFLLFTGGLRKRIVASWLHFLLWLAYLLADSIAIYTLGSLSRSQKLCHHTDGEDGLHLLLLWAPFLILHLGGQDTITAFAIEDNELWLRHLLSLVTQVGLALYVYWKSCPSAASLVAPAVVMFASGVLKYAKRTWALKSASMSSLRSSMLTRPDPGPNYAQLIEEYHSSKDAGLRAEIVIVPERLPVDDVHVPEEPMEYDELVIKAHMFFHTFRRLFVDLILSFQDRTDSLAFFRRLKRDQAYKVVEIELQLMYESLHSKSPVIHCPSGRYLRVFTLAAPILSLLVFSKAGKGRYKEADVAVTYVLLVGAIFLEIYGIILMAISSWSYADLRKLRKCPPAASRVVFQAVKYFMPEARPRWSNQMAQYNLLSYCLKDKSTWLTRVLESLEWDYNIRVKTAWDSLWYTKHIGVSLVLKQLIFKQLKDKANSTMDPMSYRRFGDHRGQWILQRKGCYQELRWSVDEVEFDESILLWHIATDLCFYDDDNQTSSDLAPAGAGGSADEGDINSGSRLPAASREMANYMLFLLVMRPFMLTASIGQIRFGDTCAEAKNFFVRLRGGEARAEERQGASALAAVKADIDPRKVKGDRSKSVLFDACRLAEQLRGMEARKRWRLVAGVWVEMMCYAAGKCRGNFHAKQLSQGGELLTVLWLLMAHFGIGDQYRVEAGHARAKLIVHN
ncbi:hypothetical protein CFC21_007350 [Triticum aestivum]|uniref:DUF4220 domain-containing protein n=4 Tax=Triticum TaxID=4564 RepID=A0A9R0VAS9_TRITD|nr:uncharacterized protein LOC123132187 [Triticum aestivum]KAF6990104.1 hypothetical protein CFC21_007350 [Triticum aestivum]VAH18992.1 unnamed protein product [Triticum turgidum subsp. durum]